VEGALLGRKTKNDTELKGRMAASAFARLLDPPPGSGFAMELGGLEPPTYWVRSTSSAAMTRAKSGRLAGI
jgi:hypothetical protein